MNTDQLQTERDNLVQEKKKHEIKLLAIRNLIRTSGRMEAGKYKDTCNSQAKHAQAILEIEGKICKITQRLREAYVPHTADEKPNKSNRQEVVSLVAIREEYQNFAADGTRVSSMRTMAAEFVLKLNPIIRSMIGNDV